MAVRIQIRRDNATNWTNNNPILAQGELGYDLDNGNFKIGTGSVAWANLPYFATKDKVGLANVQNFNIATQNEAETGTSNELYMTPLRTAEAILSKDYATQNFVAEIGGNGILWNEQDAVYNVDYASNEEVTAGTSQTKILAPASISHMVIDGGEF